MIAIEIPQIIHDGMQSQLYHMLFQHLVGQPLTADITDWLSMVLRMRQHNIGYTADGFYRSDDPTNSVKALKEGG